MPINKSALIRYRTIDECLRNRGKRFTLYDLMKKCGEALYEEEGVERGVSERTIYGDIKKMRQGILGKKAPIKNEKFKSPEFRNGRKVSSYYIYTDPTFSVFNHDLPKKDLLLLKEAVTFIKQYREFPVLKEIRGLVEKLDKKISQTIEPNNIIEFEHNDSSGLKYLDILYHAIKNKEVLTIEYKPFYKREAHTITVHPYLLKEHRNRWFLVGRSFSKDYKSSVNIFGLERIEGIAKTGKTYAQLKAFNPTEYFKYSLGTSVRPERNPQEIILSFNHERGQYIKTKPLHPSQKLLIDTDKEVRVSIKLTITRELIRLILSYREHVKIIAPKKLLSDYKAVLKRMYKMYKD